MAGLIPIAAAGGVPVSTASVKNAAVPAAPFVVSGTMSALPSDCTARILPEQINAIVSELMSLAACFAPSGTWTTASLNNLCSAFTSFVNGTGPGSLGSAVLTALNWKTCSGTAHAVNDTIPTCAEMTTAISTALAALPTDRFLQSAAYNPVTNTLTMTMSSGSPVLIDLSTLLSDVSNAAHDNPASFVPLNDAFGVLQGYIFPV
jgi:hypothetical protein